MSTATSSTEHAPDGGGHAHPKWLQHHFDTPNHQFETAKLGMWIFICTEILMFGGLFVAYTIFRGREMAHIEEGRKVMDEVLQALDDVGKVEKNPSMEGRRMTAIIAPRVP